MNEESNPDIRVRSPGWWIRCERVEWLDPPYIPGSFSPKRSQFHFPLILFITENSLLSSNRRVKLFVEGGERRHIPSLRKVGEVLKVRYGLRCSVKRAERILRETQWLMSEPGETIQRGS